MCSFTNLSLCHYLMLLMKICIFIFVSDTCDRVVAVCSDTGYLKHTKHSGEMLGNNFKNFELTCTFSKLNPSDVFVNFLINPFYLCSLFYFETGGSFIRTGG